MTIVLLLMISSIAKASPNSISLQARIIKPDGTAQEGSSVNFRINITDAVGTCIIFQEDFNSKNMAGSRGLINFEIGSGSQIFPIAPTTLAEVFNNFNSPTLSCLAGGTVIPGSTDRRKLIMQFNDGSGWQTVPIMDIHSNPYALHALQAQRLGSYPAADYLRTASLPTCGANQALHFNGTSLTCVAVGTGTILQGGNSFSASMTLGTNDAQNLILETNNTARLTIDSAGLVNLAGEIKIGNSGTACTAGTEGAFRYNLTSHMPEVCDGSNWRTIPISSSSGGCTGPGAFSFTNQTNVPLNSTITSNSVTPSGCVATMSVSVTGGGSPEISVNNGPWLTSTTIEPGESIRVRMISSASTSTPLNAVVVIGSTTGTTWSVTTKASSTRIFATPGTYLGSFGGLVAADAICQSVAGGLGYGGFWKAILSDSVAHAKDRLVVSYPVVRASNTAITVAATNLWIGSVDNSIAGTNSSIWTGSTSAGLRRYSESGKNCNDWTSNNSSQTGFRGLGHFTDPGWLGYDDQLCSNALSLYCLEQPTESGCSVNPFTFTNVSNATQSTLYTSNTITPGGCATSSEAVITGDGSPEMSINGGPWIRRGTLNPGETLAVRLTTNPTFGAATIAKIFIGGTESTWSVTAVAGGSKIFATSNLYNGSFGGLAAGDGLCQSEAAAKGYAGTWKALLSTSTVHAKDRLILTYPVTRASDGIVVASTNLWIGSITTPVDPSGVVSVWTGTLSDGTYAGFSCNDWTSSSSGLSARRGIQNFISPSWIAHDDLGCNQNYKLYCVEQ